MRITLPERCTDPELVNHLGIKPPHDTTFAIDTAGCVEITREFLQALRKRILDECAPYYGHMFIIIDKNSPIFTDVDNFVISVIPSSNTLDVVSPEECLGVCVSAADLGLPYNGIAYPHPHCPRHSVNVE